MTDQEKIELGCKELFQAAVELEEASKIIGAFLKYPMTAGLFFKAAQAKRDAATQLLPDLTGK